MKNEDNNTSAEVFGGAIWQAQMVLNLLENAGIKAYLQDEAVGSLNLPWASPGGVGVVKVVVSASDYEAAQKVVEDYEENSRDEK